LRYLIGRHSNAVNVQPHESRSRAM
jgi:hypothetical protein